MKYNNYTQYKTNIINTIKSDYSDELKAQVVRDFIDNNIATRKKAEKDKVYVYGLEVDEKICKCINENEQACKVFERFEINKGYKYSLIYNLNYIDLEKLKKLKNVALNIDCIKSDISMELLAKPFFIECDEKIIIKFDKKIDLIDMEDATKTYIRYPLLVIIHKDMNILEYRFDKITHKKDDEFYKITMKPAESWLMSNLGIVTSEYSLSEILTEIVDNPLYKHDIKEEICSLGFPGEKGIILKYGDGSVTPILGEIEDLIKENKSLFKKESIELLENFIFEKKVLSSKHFREIKWLKSPYNGKDNTENDKKLYIKNRFIFNYRNNYEDLITFYNSKYNDMERMNYVIQYIDKVKKSIK